MRIFMAPMEGVVDHAMRSLYAALGGMDAFVTEFVRVTDTRLPERVFKKYCPELAAPLTLPVKVQLLGSNPQALAENAAKVAALGASGIDLNFGCPAKTVNKNRGGACLLDEPALLFDIVAAVRAAVPAATPVTAKIRLGFHRREGYLDTAKALAGAGASELVVHARCKSDGYKPPAYWHHIAEIRAVVDIPVIANGDIWTVADYLECRRQSACDDVMLGRGLLARPDLARAIKAHHQGDTWQPMSWQAVLPWLVRFHETTVGAYPLRHCGNRLKQWLMYLSRTYPEAARLFNRIKHSRDPEFLRASLIHPDCAQ